MATNNGRQRGPTKNQATAMAPISWSRDKANNDMLLGAGLGNVMEGVCKMKPPPRCLLMRSVATSGTTLLHFDGCTIEFSRCLSLLRWPLEGRNHGTLEPRTSALLFRVEARSGALLVRYWSGRSERSRSHGLLVIGGYNGQGGRVWTGRVTSPPPPSPLSHRVNG